MSEDTTLREAEWPDEDDGPRWIALSDIDYRGGGVMGRRAKAGEWQRVDDEQPDPQED